MDNKENNFFNQINGNQVNVQQGNINSFQNISSNNQLDYEEIARKMNQLLLLKSQTDDTFDNFWKDVEKTKKLADHQESPHKIEKLKKKKKTFLNSQAMGNMVSVLSLILTGMGKN